MSKFTIPQLKYTYKDLEPYIDAQTMEIHYSKHHATYINNLNNALEKYPEIGEKPIEELLRNIESLPKEIQIPVKNNGGGHFNHSFFWSILGPKTDQNIPTDKVMFEISKYFDSFDKFKEIFEQTALGQFGSGWGWLVRDNTQTLRIFSSANQDTPVTQGFKPILTVDVWEHAYYLKYQNRRVDYIHNFWNVVDWNEVEKLLF